MRECHDDSYDGEAGFGRVVLVGDFSDVERCERQGEDRRSREGLNI